MMLSMIQCMALKISRITPEMEIMIDITRKNFESVFVSMQIAGMISVIAGSNKGSSSFHCHDVVVGELKS